MKFVILNDAIRQRVVRYVMEAETGTVATFKAGDPRNAMQNARLHAMLTDIAKQVEWHGKKLPMLVWKRLCTAAYLREIGNTPEMIPALDGVGFDVIFERTSEMPMSRTAKTHPKDPVFNELIDWVDSFGSQNGVVWSEKAQDRQ